VRVMNERRNIGKAMQLPDELAIRMVYQDRGGDVTKRIVSPIRWEEGGRFLALCLGREGVRSFKISQCSSVELVAAHELLMPEPIEEISNDV